MNTIGGGKLDKKALIIVDVQNAFHDKKWGERNNPHAEENIRKLVKLWRDKQWQVIHVQHLSDDPSSVFHPSNNGFAIKDIVKPIDGEQIITATD